MRHFYILLPTVGHPQLKRTSEHTIAHAETLKKHNDFDREHTDLQM